MGPNMIKSIPSGAIKTNTYSKQSSMKYAHKFHRPFEDGRGPQDFGKSINYNQGFTEFL